MPYADNLYSALEDESDTEPIGDSLSQPGPSELRMGPMTAISSHLEYDGRANAHASQTALALMDDVDEVDPLLLSPTDGYFASTDGASSEVQGGAASSNNVPSVPNVWVEDPSLERSTAAAKAREAEEERRGNMYGSPPQEDIGRSIPPTTESRNGLPSSDTSSSVRQSTRHASQSPGAAYHTAPAPSSNRLSSPSSYRAYAMRDIGFHGAQQSHFVPLPIEAPPAYTPSPTSPSNSQDAPRNYSTFSQPTTLGITMGLPDEAQGLLARQPQSMGGPDPDGSDAHADHSWRRRMWTYAHYCRIVVLVLVLILVSVGFLISLVSTTTSEKGPKPPSADEPKTQPRPGHPGMNYPGIDDDFSWNARDICGGAQIARPIDTYQVSFGSDNPLTLVQKVDDDSSHQEWIDVHVEGAVIFRKAGSGTPSSKVIVETVVNDERLTLDSTWNAQYQILIITVPPRVDWGRGDPRPCMSIKVTVWVPENGELDKLEVNAVHLGTRLLDNLSLSVLRVTKLTSIAGHIVAASTGVNARDDKLVDVGAPDSFRFHSRFIEVTTTAAPIKGSWPLYDYLGLRSTAGSIRVCVEPKEVDSDSPKPAILYIKSLSGNVEFREPIHATEIAHTLEGARNGQQADITADALLPPRDYRVDVQTTSGDILGAAAFSSSASFRTTSGTVSLDLLPVLDKSFAKGDAKKVALQTSSLSGTTDVKVLEPLWMDASSGGVSSYLVVDPGSQGKQNGGPLPLRGLHAQHTSTSADIKLLYPGSWEGDIELTSLTGQLKVAGEGVKLIKAGSDWPGINKSLVARKGEKGKGGRILGKTTSGNIDVVVGERVEGKGVMNWARIGAEEGGTGTR